MRWHGDEDRCPPEQTRGSTELEKGMGMANSEQKTKDGLGEGGEGGGRQRNRLGHCAELNNGYGYITFSCKVFHDILHIFMYEYLNL